MTAWLRVPQLPTELHAAKERGGYLAQGLEILILGGTHP